MAWRNCHVGGSVSPSGALKSWMPNVSASTSSVMISDAPSSAHSTGRNVSERNSKQ